MAQNEIPRSYDPLVELLEDAADGAALHGAAIDLKQNDEPALRARLEALAGKPPGPGNVPPAVPGLKALWNVAKANKVTQSGLFRSAKSGGRAIASACVGVLKPRLGNDWNNAWQTAGFANASLAIPENPLTLLQQLRAYFIANPTHEKTDLAPGIHATAAACEAAAQAISTASSASNQSNTVAGTAKKNLADGITAGRGQLTGLRGELTQLIPEDDDRWYAFGFEKPGDPETPEVPENLTAVPGGQATLFCDCDDARRAESYRFTIANAATGEVLQQKLSSESEAMFEDLPLGMTVRAMATGLNAAGESQPSAGVDVVIVT